MGTNQRPKRNIIIPKDALKDFETFLNLPEDALTAIHKRLLRGLDPLTDMTIDLINDTGLDDDKAFSSMTVVCYLNSIAEERDLMPEDILDEVRMKFHQSDLDAERKRTILDALESKRQSLIKILSKEVRQPLVERKARLAKPPYRPIIDIRSICDVRPVFDGGADTIESHMLVTLLDITYHDEDNNDRHMVFTLDERSLQKMEDAVERTRKKLEHLSKVELTVI